MPAFTQCILSSTKPSGKEQNVLKPNGPEWQIVAACVTWMHRACVTSCFKQNTLLTWYCGLYQCFRSQSHKIIWKIQKRYINCGSNVSVCVCVSEKTQCIDIVSVQALTCAPLSAHCLMSFCRGHRQGNGRATALLASLFCLLSKHTVQQRFTLSFSCSTQCTFYYRYARARCRGDGMLRHFTESKTTKTTMPRLQWSYEILSGCNYVNRQIFSCYLLVTKQKLSHFTVSQR